MNATKTPIRPRSDGRGYYANVTHPRTGARRQLSWPSEVDGQHFLAVWSNQGYDAAMEDYDRLKSRRGDRSALPSRQAGRTVADAAREYIDSRPKPSSRRSYRTRLPHLLASGLAHVPVDRLVQEDVRLWGKALLEDDTKAVSSRWLYWSFLSQVMNREVREGRASANPCLALDKRERPRQETNKAAKVHSTVASPRQFEAIVALAPTAVAGLLYRLLYESGLRYGEALALQPQHVIPDGDETRLDVRQTWAYRSPEDGGGKYLGPVKGGEPRDVYVSAELGAALLALPVDKHGCLAFPSRSYLNDSWDRMRRQAARQGLAPRGVRVHDLRHSHCTNLLAAGHSPVEVSERMGHASVQFTLDRYAHVINKAQRAMAHLS